jgi:peptide/nickel transport system permease protein
VNRSRAVPRPAGTTGWIGVAVLAAYALAALVAPLLVPDSALRATTAPGLPFAPPSPRFWLGTDIFGRSMLAVTLRGSQVSLAIGLLATLLAISLGTTVGILAGHLGGWADTLLMGLTEWLLVLPSLVLAAALSTVLCPGIHTTVLAIGLTCWPATARLVRARVLTIGTMPYIERAVALGAGHRHLIVHHLAGAVAPLVLVQTTLSIADALLTESTLAFLGLGDPQALSWGTILYQARQAGSFSSGHWWIILPPGLAIVGASLAFVLVGNPLERSLHPHLRTPR